MRLLECRPALEKKGVTNNKEMVHPCPSSNTLNIASIANFSSKSWEIQLEILIWLENRQLYVYHAPGRKNIAESPRPSHSKTGFPSLSGLRGPACVFCDKECQEILVKSFVKVKCTQ